MHDKEKKAVKDFRYTLDNPDTKFWIGTDGMKNIDIILNLVERQKAEIEKKDKIIDLMAEYIKEPYRVIAFGSRKPKTEIIKEYFKNKVKESK